MEDLIKSIKAHLYDRATSPLIGTFAVSWALWNYRFVVTVFSSMDAHEKFDYISTFLYSSSEACLLTGILYPLLTTLAFIFVYPYPARYVYSFVRKRQKELKEIKQQIEDETPLTHAESRKLRREMSRLEIASGNEIARLRSENEKLKAVITELEIKTDPGIQNEFGELQKDKASSDTGNKRSMQVTDKQIGYLKLLAEAEDLGLDDILDASDPTTQSMAKLKYDMHELEKMKLVISRNPNGQLVYQITHKGRALLVEKELI